MFTLVWIIALLGVSSDTILRRAVNMSIDFMMTMMMTKEEEQNRFKMHIYYHFCWLEDCLKHNGGVPDEIQRQRNWEIVRKSLRNTIYFLSLLF